MSNTCSGTTRTGAACRNPVAESGGNCGRCKGPAGPAGSGGRADVLDVDELGGEGRLNIISESNAETAAARKELERTDDRDEKFTICETETDRLRTVAASIIADEVYPGCEYVDLIGDDYGFGWGLTEVHCYDFSGTTYGIISGTDVTDDGGADHKVSSATWGQLEEVGGQFHEFDLIQWQNTSDR